MRVLLPLLAVLALLAGCGEPRRAFREASLEQANALLADPEVAVVEALDGRARGFGALSRGVRWRLDDPPGRRQPVVRPGAVLVLGSSQAAGFRSAAELARTDHAPVWVFVPRSEEERAALVVPAVQAKEAAGERDS
jgi:hypothetical protein